MSKWLVVVALAGCGGSSDKIGVAACDAYLDRAADAWRQSAGDPARRDMLPKACEAALADAKKQVPQCEW